MRHKHLGGLVDMVNYWLNPKVGRVAWTKVDQIMTCLRLLKDYNLLIGFRHSSRIRQEIFDLLRFPAVKLMPVYRDF